MKNADSVVFVVDVEWEKIL